VNKIRTSEVRASEAGTVELCIPKFGKFQIGTIKYQLQLGVRCPILLDRSRSLPCDFQVFRIRQSELSKRH